MNGLDLELGKLLTLLWGLNADVLVVAVVLLVLDQNSPPRVVGRPRRHMPDVP